MKIIFFLNATQKKKNKFYNKFHIEKGHGSVHVLHTCSPVSCEIEMCPPYFSLYFSALAIVYLRAELQSYSSYIYGKEECVFLPCFSQTRKTVFNVWNIKYSCIYFVLGLKSQGAHKCWDFVIKFKHLLKKTTYPMSKVGLHFEPLCWHLRPTRECQGSNR